MKGGRQVVDGILGISRPDGEYPHVCSCCVKTIPEDDVPLMLWDNHDDSVMWVICSECSPDVLMKSVVKEIERRDACKR